MNLFTRERGWAFVTLVALIALVAPRAHAQPGSWDHYKVYQVDPPAQANTSVVLLDQFGASNHVVLNRPMLANPVEKRHPPVGGAIFPINDPRLHYTWWRIDQQPVDRLINVSNQFGDQDLHLSSTVLLLTPALKNEQGPLPLANHYKCYACEGQAVNEPIRMIDQFDTWDATVAFPRFFCTPVEKRIPPNQVFPIVNPDQHYVVYDFTPLDPIIADVTIIDQFFPQPFTVETLESDFIMVPSLKATVTPSQSNTWGRLKTIYR